jgi:hypothetical protein
MRILNRALFIIGLLVLTASTAYMFRRTVIEHNFTVVNFEEMPEEDVEEVTE